MIKSRSTLLLGITFIILTLPKFLFSQNVSNTSSKKNIYGIVQDSVGSGVLGAVVSLYSKNDTLKTITDNEGIFNFTNVKSSVFTIKVEALGFVPKVFNGKYNENQTEITLTPIILNTSFQILETVIVNGTPTIIYKTDTIEYRAKDYVVRAGDKIDELLKKMEGVNVEKDGTVVINGQKVEKSKLNGREIYGGSVATTVQNLPAEIVDKIQFIDDYGTLASRTGNKEGAAQKTLNITTKIEKSIGNILGFNLAAGTQEQVEGGSNYSRINKNETLTVNLRGLNSLAGIAGSNYKNGQLNSAKFELPNELISGGNNFSIIPRIGLNTQFGSKVNFNFNYSLNAFKKNNFLNSNGQTISNLGIIDDLSSRNFDLNQIENTSYFNLEYNIDSLNFLSIYPQINTVSFNNKGLNSNSLSGLINQNQNFGNVTDNKSINFKTTAIYQHLWANKKSKNLTTELFVNFNNFNNDLNQNLKIDYLDNNMVVGDSISNVSIIDNYQLKHYRPKVSFNLPLLGSRYLVLTQTLNFKNFNNSKNTLGSNTNTLTRIDSLSNLFNYNFYQSTSGLTYNFNKYNNKLNGYLGVNLFYSKFYSSNSNQSLNFTEPKLNLLPTLRLNYSFTQTQQASLYHFSTITEPSLQQLQPIGDISTPQNIVLGNPSLSFGKSLYSYFTYSNYLMYSKINMSLNINSVINQNAVGTNILQVQDNFGSLRNQIIYTNVKDNANNNFNFNIAKQFNNRKYSLEFKSRLNQNKLIQLSNELENKSNTLNLSQNLIGKINPNDKLEINPSLSIDNSFTSYSLLEGRTIKQQILSLNLNTVYYYKTNQSFSSSISQGFVSGIENNQNKKPLILNAMYKHKFKKGNGELSFSVYDAFKQNNFIVRNFSAEGFKEILTNTNSRYFMVGFVYNLQKWNSAKNKTGESIKRKGDGSFLN
jgi:hypothetical protein